MADKIEIVRLDAEGNVKETLHVLGDALGEAWDAGAHAKLSKLLLDLRVDSELERRLHSEAATRTRTWTDLPPAPPPLPRSAAR